MPDDPLWRDLWIGLPEQRSDGHQLVVLRGSERLKVSALQLNPYGEVITVIAPFEKRLARVPGLAIKSDILGYSTVSGNKQMSGHSKLCNLFKIWMFSRIEPITEQFIDVPATIFSRRQTDVVNHQQINCGARLPFAAVRRLYLSRKAKMMIDDQFSLQIIFIQR